MAVHLGADQALRDVVGPVARNRHAHPVVAAGDPVAHVLDSGIGCRGRAYPLPFAYARAVDRGFILSDHIDWPALMTVIQQSGAERVIATNGYTDTVARYLTERGERRTVLVATSGDTGSAAIEAFRGLDDKMADMVFKGSVKVNTVDLMRSQTSRTGATYTLLSSARLAS